MKPPSAVLRRLLTAALVVLPPLAGLDLCTVGALAGRSDLMCGMERSAAPCDAPPACPHCAPNRSAPTPPPAPGPFGPTCCDLRPQAAGAGEAPGLGAPVPVAHPALAAPDPVGAPTPMPAIACVEPDDGLAPPGQSPPPLSPRAPPLG